MKKNTLLLFFCLLFISFKLFAQPNVFSGTWQMEYFSGTSMPVLTMQLKIATPEKNLLFPAHIILQCDSFNAAYDLLIIKKSSRELAISKNKFAVSEKPFSMGDALLFLNGIFNLSRNLKGQLNLHLTRIQSKQNSTLTPDIIKLGIPQNQTAWQLLNFLKNADIRLTKLNDSPWADGNSSRILSPTTSPGYFGLKDTVYLPTRDGIMNISGIKKTDIISLSSNGNMLVDLFTINKKPHTEDILLDTGLNVLVLFADNFGDSTASKGKINFAFDKKKFNLDFTNKADSAATFIAVKIYSDPEKAKGIYLDNYPAPPTEKLKSNDKLIGSIIATSQKIKLALWDDAVEDGDSISISINGQWITRGFPVKKNTQFITVTLKPGTNTINFIADNLGSIPPNTSVLEIIDGAKRKSYTLETTPGENNLIRIFYEVKGN